MLKNFAESDISTKDVSSVRGVASCCIVIYKHTCFEVEKVTQPQKRFNEFKQISSLIIYIIKFSHM